MIPDAEIISLVCTVLTRLEVGEFLLKVKLSKPSTGMVSTLTLLRVLAEQPKNPRWYLRSMRCPSRQNPNHLFGSR